MQQARSAALVASLAFAFASTLVGQAAADFRTPDGSRFVLVADPAMRHVEWAIATPADPAEDAPGLEGLAAAVATASLGGTWRTGSIDAARERAALDRVDAAWGQIFATKGSAPAQAELVAAQTEAEALGDVNVYRRVLAALPVDRPEVLTVGPTCVLQLTTVPEALGEVADLLLERREQQALRQLPRIWADELVARQREHDADPRISAYAELVALAMPGDPAIRRFERPGLVPPRRDQALQAWARTQHPGRSVHVLIGGFDPRALRSLLERKFTATGLTRPDLPTVPAIRPITGERRSTVPGAGENLVAIAWQVPRGTDPLLLQALARWLAGADGRLPLALRDAGREQAQIRASSPWPPSLTSSDLLLVEVADPQPAKLADLALGVCRSAAKTGPTADEMKVLLQDLQENAASTAADARHRARDLAAQTLRWPDAPLRDDVARRVTLTKLRELAATVLGGRPVVVEARR